MANRIKPGPLEQEGSKQQAAGGDGDKGKGTGPLALGLGVSFFINNNS
jgi:hypothetical protein